MAKDENTNKKRDVTRAETPSHKNQEALEKITGSRWKKYSRVALSALGAIPWVGSLLSVAATLSSEKDQGKVNDIFLLWAQEHETKLNELGVTLGEVFARLDSFGETIKGRIESDDYLILVRKTFRQWDESETAEKKDMLRKLITNAAGTELSHDDLVRLFLEWIDKYHEFHFMVIREIYSNPRVTRRQIWTNLREDIPREDSADADLFKLLIRDLSTGGVIRQERETDYAGNYIRKRSQTKRGGNTLESAFEDTKPYVLTDLGSQFVHYVMDDLAIQIE